MMKWLASVCSSYRGRVHDAELRFKEGHRLTCDDCVHTEACVMHKEVVALGADLEKVRAENAALKFELAEAHEELSRQQQAAGDAAHVIVEAGIGHSTLNDCGCEQCERVRFGLIDAGYLKEER